MPTSPDVRRLVTYVPDVTAQEVARRAALDGHSVSSWLSRLVVDALGAGPNPGDLDDEAHAPSLPTRTTRGTPQGFAATLGGAKERRNREGFGVLEVRPGANPWSCAGDLAAAAGPQLTMESLGYGWQSGSLIPGPLQRATPLGPSGSW